MACCGDRRVAQRAHAAPPPFRAGRVGGVTRPTTGVLLEYIGARVLGGHWTLHRRCLSVRRQRSAPGRPRPRRRLHDGRAWPETGARQRRSVALAYNKNVLVRRKLMSAILVPIDASQVPEKERGRQKVRVAIRAGKHIASEVISVEAGRGEAKFEIEHAGPVTIAIGPENAHAAELFNRNTPTVTVRPLRGEERPIYRVEPILIPRPIWEWWLIWCRTFTITGHIYGTDGNPVAGAQVTAQEVEWFWWWSSAWQVGTAVTDASGYFSLSFTWCCGWLPWYWWELRQWRLDPILLEKIDPVLRLNPNLRISKPNPKLELHFSDFNPQPDPPGRHAIQRIVG